jgi:predicted permease
VLQRVLCILRSSWRSLFRRNEIDHDLDDEVRSHLVLLADEKIAEGMKPGEARRAARIELGGILEQVKERVRETRASAWLDTLVQDVRFGLRMFRKNPGFTAVAVLTLALGIGANTAIFSMANGVLLHSLPYRDPQQLYVVNEDAPQFNSHSPWAPWFPVNAGNFLLWQGRCPAISSMALIGETTFNMTGSGIPRQVKVLRVSAHFFQMMGIRPQIGRAFLPEEDQLGRDREVILTAAFWQRALNSDPAIVGKSITLDGAPYTVVGIMPENFVFPELPRLSGYTPELFKPFGFQGADFWSGLGGFNYIALARLKPGASPREAVAQLNVVEAGIATRGDARRRVPPGEFDLRAALRPLKTVVAGPVQRALWMLMVAAGFVLLIICVNLSSLMLERNIDRTHEVAVRSVLGATARRLVRQFLVEGLILISAGGALGLILASLSLRYLIRDAPIDMPRLGEIHIDIVVLLFSSGAALVSVLLFAFLPALRLSRVEPVEALKFAGPTVSGAYKTARLRGALVVSQIALCGVLLAGALMLVQSLHRVVRVNQWMDEQHVLSIEVAVPPAEFRSEQQANHFFSALLGGVLSLPGVRSAGFTSQLPLLGPDFTDGIDFREASQPRDRPETGQFRFVTPGYFQAIGLPLVEGRWLSDADSGKDVALISKTVARTSLPNRDPIGVHLLWAELPPPRPYQIIGVVADVRDASDGPAEPTVYLPLWASYRQGSTLIVRSGMNPTALEKSIGRVVWSVDPEVAIPRERTLKSIVASSEAARRYETSLGALFAALALLLAAVGLYGVVSYSVRQRSHEIGIRVALGAQPRDILRDVLGHGARLGLLGVALGIAAALGLTRLMASVLFAVSASDPLTFAAVVAVLFGIALLASWVPARKAMCTDPIASLRHE